jgi:CheY-like chemotaxis protein
MHPKVLLADDNLTVQRIVAATLRGGGFDVAVVGDGSAALDSVKTTPPDLILADFNLEGINLFAFAKSARTESGLADVPIWALIGPTDTYDADQLKSAGIQSCFQKPIDSIHLLQTVRMHFPVNKDVNEPTLLMTSLPVASEGAALSASQTFPSERVESVLLLLPAPEAETPQNKSALPADRSPVVDDLPLSFCAVQPTVEPIESCVVPVSAMDEPILDIFPMTPEAGGADSALSTEAVPPPATDVSPNATEAQPFVARIPVISAEQVGQAVAAALPEILRSILTPEMIHAALEKVVREVVPPIAEAEIIKEIKRLEPSAK